MAAGAGDCEAKNPLPDGVDLLICDIQAELPCVSLCV